MSEKIETKTKKTELAVDIFKRLDKLPLIGGRAKIIVFLSDGKETVEAWFFAEIPKWHGILVIYDEDKRVLIAESENPIRALEELISYVENFYDEFQITGATVAYL
jgi:hypothetical protein